jgi:hypothetical protein
MIGDYCQWLVSNPDELRGISTSTLPQEIESKVLSILPSSTTTASLHAIDTRLEDTRQLKYARYAMRCVKKATTYAQNIVGKDRQDHAMTLLAQSNLARFHLFQAMDLDSTYSLLSGNNDKLGWLSLLAILQPVSMSARKAVEARHRFIWGEYKTVFQIRDELRNKVGASLKDAHSSTSRKGPIGGRLGRALGAAVAVPAVAGVAAVGAIGVMAGLPLAAGVAAISGLLNREGIDHEPTDLSLGITTLATVFTNAVQECDRVQVGANVGAKSQSLNIRLASAQLRLSRWGVSIGLDREHMSDARALDSDDLKGTLHEESIRAAGAALEQILSILETAQNMSDLYSAATGDNTITTQPATPVYQRMRSMALNRLNHNLLRKREKWWLTDLKEFQRLIWYIINLESDLEKLFPGSEDVRQQLAVEEAKILTEPTILSSLREALQEQDGFEDDVLRKAIATVQPTIQAR